MRLAGGLGRRALRHEQRNLVAMAKVIEVHWNGSFSKREHVPGPLSRTMPTKMSRAMRRL